MLTDRILEEEFDKDGERWFNSHRNLEQDLHLAAELGKTLLDQNHELEEALQQMYSTNQEQLQEIEYLTKQVDLLRQMNDHHAKLYEQLDVTARDLEQGNQRLVQDNRLSQQKIKSLTETIDSLQNHMDDHEVEQLKTSQADRNRRETEQRHALGAQSVSCLKELYDLQDNRHIHNDHTEGLWSQQVFHLNQKPCPDSEEEHRDLQRCIETLHSQIAIERSYREAAEQEIVFTARENRSLEERLVLLDGCRARKQELEAEVEQLRRLWQRDCANKSGQLLLLPDTVFFSSEENPGSEQSETSEKLSDEDTRLSRQRFNSDSVLTATDEIRLSHDQMCIRRAEAVKQRGMSLLHEVDAQYSALQVKYEELLQRCKQASDRLTHKAVQTSTSPFVKSRSRRRLSDLAVVCEDAQPEYKVLFRELFTCIHKTKEDLSQSSFTSK
ncbi:cerebellar degeneration-related protein 2 isoform X2 [Eucyclogobius newberryi]|uniref:cerebellar degeneration-related protein 2 isoform X2 n=1 Tax=Eucyclogobius newberryi TaxID=166745 RepID=UPI003B5A5099